MVAPLLWDEVVGHAAVKESLKRSVELGRINHAYLFTGPSAVGKFMFARTFAAAVLCPENGCGECRTCRLVMAGKHPDVTVVRPAGKNIPVEVIREMRLSAFRKPVEGDRKIYIIKNAERMWDEGASTLLKVLEEPPAGVVFILLTANPAAMLATIRSRCQEVSFSMVQFDELCDYLVEVKDVTREQADLFVRLTGGVLGRALDWCDEPWRLARRNNVIDAARRLRRADLDRVMVDAQDLFRDIRAPVDELAAEYLERKRDLTDGSLDDALVRRVGKELDEELKREQIKSEIRGVKEVLSILAWWYRDILILKEGGERDLLVNLDLAEEIEDESEVTTETGLLKGIDLIEGSIRDAERNVPPLLNLESTLLGLQEVLYA